MVRSLHHLPLQSFASASSFSRFCASPSPRLPLLISSALALFFHVLVHFWLSLGFSSSGQRALAGFLRARFRERRMRVRYVDAVVGAAVSRHRIYRGRTARRYVKEGARSIADRYLGRSLYVHSFHSLFSRLHTFPFFRFSFFAFVSLPRRVALTTPSRFCFHAFLFFYADFSKLV